MHLLSIKAEHFHELAHNIQGNAWPHKLHEWPKMALTSPPPCSKHDYNQTIEMSQLKMKLHSNPSLGFVTFAITTHSKGLH